jgi:hypothetical protein
MSESDFTNAALGGPKDIEIRALREGVEVFKTQTHGFRGPKTLGTTFEVDYDSNARYEFKIDEVTLISPGSHWLWSSSRPGNWIFDGRRTFGSGSSIRFVDQKVQ